MCSGTVIFFIGAFFTWTFVAGMFFVGAMVTSVGCETMIELEDAELYDVFSREVNEILADALAGNPAFDGVTWEIPDILDACQLNQGMYRVFHLENVYEVRDLLDWQSTYSIDESFDAVKDNVNVALTNVVAETTLSPGDEAALRQLSTLLASVLASLAAITSLTPEAIFDANAYIAYQDELTKFKNEIPAGGEDADLRDYFDRVDALETLNAAAQDQLTLTLAAVSGLEDSLAYNGLGADLVLDGIPGAVSDANAYIAGAGSAEINLILEDSLNELVGDGDQYVAYAVDFVDNELGRCQPIYDIYWGIVNASCYEVRVNYETI